MSSATHTLEVFASVFSTAPIETHQIPHGLTLRQWLDANMPGHEARSAGLEYTQPLDIPVVCNVACYLAPQKGAIQGILKPLFKILGLAPTKPKTAQQQAQGKDLDLSTVQGNQVRYGQVVPERFGKNKVYGDIIVPARRYFENERDHWTEILLCLGVGEFDAPLSEVRFAGSPVIGLGGGAYARVYQPGESLAAEPAAQWWHTAKEVGGTSGGTAGIPLRTTFEATRQAPQGLYLVSGKTVIPTGDQLIPDDWESGMYLTIEILKSYTVSGSTLSGDFTGLQVTAGDTVDLNGDYLGEFEVESFTPPTGASAGTASQWSAEDPPELDYSGTPATFVVNVGSVSGVFTVNALYTDEASLVTALNAMLDQTALRGIARFQTGITIIELPTYSGRRISVNNTVGADRMFGDIDAANLATVTGTPASAGTGAKLKLVDFASDTSPVELSINKRGERFVITGVTTGQLVVDRVDENNVSTWLGWGAGFETLDISIQIDPDSVEGGWVGAYSATPGDELCTAIEWDVMFPQGLVGIDKKGRLQYTTVDVDVRFRSDNNDPWEVISKSYSYAKKDAIAITERETFAVPRKIKEFEIRRKTAESVRAQISNAAELFGLRSKISRSPTAYPDFTTLAIRVKGVVSAESEEMVSAICTRKIDGVPERSIAAAVRYIAKRAELDEDALDDLDAVWQARDDKFDFSFEKPATIKQALGTALSVGFADFTVEDGLIKPVRDSKRPDELISAYTHSFSYQNTTSTISTSYNLDRADQVDGIDVEYIDETSFRVETIRCEEPGSLGLKVEKVTADGIINRDRAFRWGMRRLMERKYDRVQHKTRTELDALNAAYGSYVAFINEVPGWSQSAMAAGVSGLVIKSTEPLDWQSGGDHVAALRRPDGTMTKEKAATRVDDYTLSVPDAWDITPSPYETVIYFGVRQRFVNTGIVRSVVPNGMQVTISAVGYNPLRYQYDNAEAPAQ